ncbi:MAG: 50S ribosomal protein L4 [Candidatus Omnitrophota bacterium]|jgi:large subunit ribosomal protein L4
MVTLPIYNTEGKEIDTHKLDGIFDGKVNKDILHQAITAYRANQRRGLAAVKTMGEVSGGGRKPWKQKGTGRARAGSIRSPLWRHGGVVFGPIPRDFSYTIPEKIKKLALLSALNAKINESNFMLIDALKLEQPKTKEAAKVLSNLKIKGVKALLLLEKAEQKVKIASRNIDTLTINQAQDTNAYEVLSVKKIVVTKEALRALTSRLKR